MLTSTVATIADVLPSLATIAAGTTRTARKGKRIRTYHELTTLVGAADSPIMVAVQSLVKSGYAVRVYEGSTIYTAKLADDGTVVWTSRTTTRTRDYVCVEVAL